METVVILWSTQKKKSPKLPDIKGFEGLISEKHYCSVPSSSCRENSGKPEFFLFPLDR